MTQRLNLLIILFCLTIITAVGQTQRKEFVLNKDNRFKHTERLSICNLTVKAHPNHDGESAEIEIAIYNTTDGVLILFQESQGWKGVKSINSPKIRAVNKEAEKNFERDGIQGYRNLEQITVFDINENMPLRFKRPLVVNRDDEPLELELHVYTAMVKSRDKTTQLINEVKLNSHERLPMTIIVELGPDKELEELKVLSEEFVSKMKETPCFCTNSAHTPDVKGEAEKRLQELKNRIKAACSKRLEVNNDESVSQPYDELINRINNAFAGVEEKDCGIHKKPKKDETTHKDPKVKKPRKPKSKNDDPSDIKPQRTCKDNIIPSLEGILKRVNNGNKANALTNASRLVNEAKGLSDYNACQGKINQIYKKIQSKVK